MPNQKSLERGLFAATFVLVIVAVIGLIAASAPAAPPTLESFAPAVAAPQVAPAPVADEIAAAPVVGDEIAAAPERAAAPVVADVPPAELLVPRASTVAVEAPATPQAAVVEPAAEEPVVADPQPEAPAAESADEVAPLAAEESVAPTGLVEVEVHAAVIPDPPAPASSTTTEIVLAPPPYDPWLPVRMCESTNTYDINTGNGFYGAYQFTISTWNWVSEIIDRDDLIGVRPDLAAPADQDRMAQALAFEIAGGGLHHWPVCGRFYGS